MKTNTTLRIYLLMQFIFLFVFLFFYFPKVKAASCSTCGSGYSSCDSGAYCCAWGCPGGLVYVGSPYYQCCDPYLAPPASCGPATLVGSYECPPPDDGDGTSTKGQILGRIYTDLSGNGSPNWEVETIEDTSAGCTNNNLKFSGVTVTDTSGTNKLGSWTCDTPDSTGRSAYFKTVDYDANSNPTIRVNFPSITGINCSSDVSWSYTKCDSTRCWAAGSGSGCSATLSSILEGSGNWIWFKVNPSPPTVCFTSGFSQYKTWFNVFPGTSFSYTWSANDSRSDMFQTDTYWRYSSTGPSGPWNIGWTLKGRDSYTERSSRTGTSSWTPSNGNGWYQFVLNTHGRLGGFATHNPDITSFPWFIPNSTNPTGVVTYSGDCAGVYVHVCGALPAQPTNNSCTGTENSITPVWNLLTGASQGSVCVPPIKMSYSVYYGTSPSNVTTPGCTSGIDPTTGSCTIPGLTANTTYYWSVKPNNGEYDGPLSAPTACTTLPCNAAPGQPTNLTCTTTATSFNVQWTLPDFGKVCSTWDPKSYVKYSTDPANINTLVGTVAWPGNTISKSGLSAGTDYWVNVQAWNGELYGVVSAPVLCHTKDLSKDWFTGINGDIFAPGIKLSGIPSTSFWSPSTLGYGFSTVLNGGSSNISLNNGASPVDSANSNIWADRLPSYPADRTMWNPLPSDLTIPSNAKSINNSSDFANLNINSMYKYSGDFDDLADGVSDGVFKYNLSGDGVVIIYLNPSASDDNDVYINDPIKSVSNSMRLIFITNKNVHIGKKLYTTNPTTSSPSNIEAAIVTSKNIYFSKVDDGINPSIVTEGPLVAKQKIYFERMPLSTTQSPTEVVKYNPLYLGELTKMIRETGKFHKSGIFTNEIIWGGDL